MSAVVSALIERLKTSKNSAVPTDVISCNQEKSYVGSVPESRVFEEITSNAWSVTGLLSKKEESQASSIQTHATSSEQELVMPLSGEELDPLCDLVTCIKCQWLVGMECKNWRRADLSGPVVIVTLPQRCHGFAAKTLVTIN